VRRTKPTKEWQGKYTIVSLLSTVFVLDWGFSLVLDHETTAKDYRWFIDAVMFVACELSEPSWDYPISSGTYIINSSLPRELTSTFQHRQLLISVLSLLKASRSTSWQTLSKCDRARRRGRLCSRHRPRPSICCDVFPEFLRSQHRVYV
jgi:hypothetical protein